MRHKTNGIRLFHILPSALLCEIHIQSPGCEMNFSISCVVLISLLHLKQTSLRNLQEMYYFYKCRNVTGIIKAIYADFSNLPSRFEKILTTDYNRDFIWLKYSPL